MFWPLMSSAILDLTINCSAMCVASFSFLLLGQVVGLNRLPAVCLASLAGPLHLACYQHAQGVVGVRGNHHVLAPDCLSDLGLHDVCFDHWITSLRFTPSIGAIHPVNGYSMQLVEEFIKARQKPPPKRPPNRGFTGEFG